MKEKSEMFFLIIILYFLLYILFLIPEYASKYCQLNGTWEPNPKINNSTVGYTNYTKCFFPGTLYLFQMCDKIGREKCKSVSYVLIEFSMLYGISYIKYIE